MLQQILESRYDSAVLSFLLLAPERSFSALEIAGRIGMSMAKVTLCLNTFAKHGIVTSFSKRGKKYYIVNPKYKLLPEIKASLVKNGQRYTDELFTAIQKLGDIRAAFLSGLFTGYPNLPVDILLVGKINLKKLDEFLKLVEKVMGQEINYSVMTEDEFQLRKDTFDRFIKDIFDYRHLTVVNNIQNKKKKKEYRFF
jgi:hypothetical protein